MPKRRVKRHAVTQPLDQSYRLIPLTRNQNAIVDVSDFLELSKYNWFAGWNQNTNSFYARRRRQPKEERQYLSMHIEIMGGPCDHRNFDTLDNRRENLRMCTLEQNARNKRKYSNNTSGFKGVRFDKRREKWAAQVGYKHLGYFDSTEQAARAYDEAAKILFGEFAFLNFQ